MNIKLELSIILLGIGIISAIRCLVGLLGFLSLFLTPKYAKAYYYLCLVLFLLDIILLILVNVELKLIVSKISSSLF